MIIFTRKITTNSPKYMDIYIILYKNDLHRHFSKIRRELLR